MKQKILTILSFLMVALVFAGCASKPEQTANSQVAKDEGDKGKLNIVTTIFPQYDFVREIAGDKVELKMLLPPGADSHSFEPSPQDIIAIQNCDMFIYVGGDSDEWIRGILDSIDTSSIRVLAMMDMVQTKPEVITEGMEHDHHGHDHPAIDPDNIQDRPLSDWNGLWNSAEKPLKEGALHGFVEHLADESGLTPAEQQLLLEKAWASDYQTISIQDKTISVKTDAGQQEGEYEYEGYIVAGKEDQPQVWYCYRRSQTKETVLPERVVINDHGDGHDHEEHGHENEEHVAHMHLRYGSEKFEELVAMEDWTPLYYDGQASNEQMGAMMTAHLEDHDHDHDHEQDEHVWTSPKNAMKIVQTLSEELCSLDTTNQQEFQQNTGNYLKKLEELDRAFDEIVSKGQRNTIVFGDRFPFLYLAGDYGIQYYAAFSGCSTQTEASSPTIAFLIDKVKSEDIPVVFHIEMSSEKMADTICEATGAAKRELHSCHNLTRQELEAGETYLSLMTRNTEVLKEALQ